MNRNPYHGPRQPRYLPSLCGPLELVTPPAANAFAVAPRNQSSSLNLAKLHIRIAHDQVAEDDLIEQYLQAAVRFCEERIDGSRTFLHTTFDMPVQHWWFEASGLCLWSCNNMTWGGRQMNENGMREQLPIPRPPLSSVTWVKYFDTAGSEQILDPSFYLVRTPQRQIGTIERAPLKVFPAIQSDREYPITVRFVAGWGDGVATFPPVEVQQAVLLALGWMYADREPSDRELSAVDSLLQTVAYGVYG